MKVKEIDIQQKQWQPVKLEIILETVEEARLLFHVFNNVDLMGAFECEEEYDLNPYSQNIARAFFAGIDEVEQAIKKQGFEV